MKQTDRQVPNRDATPDLFHQQSPANRPVSEKSFTSPTKTVKPVTPIIVLIDASD